MPVILALRRLKQENHEFKNNLVYVMIPCLKKYQNSKKKPSRTRDMAQQLWALVAFAKDPGAVPITHMVFPIHSPVLTPMCLMYM